MAEDINNRPSLAHELGQATSDGERTDAWVAHTTDNPDVLAEDNAFAAGLIIDGDIPALRVHLSRHSKDRAAAHVARIHSQRPDGELPPAA